MPVTVIDSVVIAYSHFEQRVEAAGQNIAEIQVELDFGICSESNRLVAHGIGRPSSHRNLQWQRRSQTVLPGVGNKARSTRKKLICTLRSDTLLQHQSDPRLHSSLIPTRCQKDNTNRVDLAARTAWVDVTGASNGSGRTRVGRSHRRRLAHHFAGVYVIERCFVSS